MDVKKTELNEKSEKRKIKERSRMLLYDLIGGQADVSNIRGISTFKVTHTNIHSHIHKRIRIYTHIHT